MVGASCIDAMRFTRRHRFIFQRGQAAEETVEHGARPNGESDVAEGVDRIKRKALSEEEHELTQRHFSRNE